MVELLTARLRLRRARPEDAEALFEVFGDPRAMRYWSTPPHQDIQQTRQFVDAMIAAPADVCDDFVVEFQGRPVGKAGCWRLPEVGFILHPDLWGQGLAREALETVIDRVFSAHALRAITADVDPRNRRSLGLLERLGFGETGRARSTWQVGGEWCDSIYLELPRPGVTAPAEP